MLQTAGRMRDGVRERDRLDICREQRLRKIRRRQVQARLSCVGEPSRSAVLQLRYVQGRVREGCHESMEEGRDLPRRDFGAPDRSARGTVHHLDVKEVEFIFCYMF